MFPQDRDHKSRRDHPRPLPRVHIRQEGLELRPEGGLCEPDQSEGRAQVREEPAEGLRGEQRLQRRGAERPRVARRRPGGGREGVHHQRRFRATPRAARERRGGGACRGERVRSGRRFGLRWCSSVAFGDQSFGLTYRLRLLVPPPIADLLLALLPSLQQCTGARRHQVRETIRGPFPGDHARLRRRPFRRRCRARPRAPVGRPHGPTRLHRPVRRQC
mmetsp:Transcript_70767/g.118356  ORF Transcript_70767/g.118356 Transcript_70767/m.118356 type:complete len:218 (-) Transcript_70767:54-707(-)